MCICTFSPVSKTARSFSPSILKRNLQYFKRFGRPFLSQCKFQLFMTDLFYIFIIRYDGSDTFCTVVHKTRVPSLYVLLYPCWWILLSSHVVSFFRCKQSSLDDSDDVAFYSQSSNDRQILSHFWLDERHLIYKKNPWIILWGDWYQSTADIFSVKWNVGVVCKPLLPSADLPPVIPYQQYSIKDVLIGELENGSRFMLR